MRVPNPLLTWWGNNEIDGQTHIPAHQCLIWLCFYNYPSLGALMAHTMVIGGPGPFMCLNSKRKAFIHGQHDTQE